MLGCQFGTHKLGGQLAPLGGRFLDNDLAPLRVPSGTFFRNSVLQRTSNHFDTHCLLFANDCSSDVPRALQTELLHVCQALLFHDRALAAGNDMTTANHYFRAAESNLVLAIALFTSTDKEIVELGPFRDIATAFFRGGPHFSMTLNIGMLSEIELSTCLLLL